MKNPYESPKTPPAKPSAPTNLFLTRHHVFWFGVALITAALMSLTGSHSLFVESRANAGASDTIVFIIDCLGGMGILAGVIAIIVCHWFPDSRRKYSWRPKSKKGDAR